MKTLIAVLLLLPSLAFGQTDHGRIRSPGVQAGKFNNTATVVLTGATPDVSGGNVFKTSNGSPTTVTNLTGGVDTQKVTIICGDTNTTFQNNANISLTGGTNFTCVLNQSIEVVFNAASAVWSQVGGNGSGAGGGSSSGTAGIVQKSGGGGAFAQSQITDDDVTGKITFARPTIHAGDNQFGGPNPHFDLRAFGGYASNAPPSTTGSITAGTTTLTVANAQDFANGQGIVVWKAGPNATVSALLQPTVTPLFLGGGATTYNYQVVPEDRSGGLGAASPTGTTTTGPATLGSNTINLTSCVRVNGVSTYTSSGAHNLLAGAQVSINGFGFFSLCSGVKTIATVPLSTTFTTNDGSGALDETNNLAATAVVYACIKLDFPSLSASPTAIRNWVYRDGVIRGVAQGMDPFFLDCGATAPAAPGYVPTSPPGAAQPGYLASTIVSGGGTTTLTLANAASNTAASQVVLHDNSIPLVNCLFTAINSTSAGGTCYVPNMGAHPFPFNATTILTNVGGTHGGKIHLNAAITLNQPLILRSNMELEGEARDTTSFMAVPGTTINGTAYPMALIPDGSQIRLNQLLFRNNNSQQIGLLSDAPFSNNGGSIEINVEDVAFAAQGNNTSVVMKGGAFLITFKRVNIDSGSALAGAPNTAILFQVPSPAVIGTAGTPQVPGIVKIDDLTLENKGITFDCTPFPARQVFDFSYSIHNVLFESITSPFVKMNCNGAPSGILGFSFRNVVLADSVAAVGTPTIDAQNIASMDANWQGGGVFNVTSPLMIGGSGVNPLINYSTTNPGTCCGMRISGSGLSSTLPAVTTSPAYIGQAMPQSVAPGAVVGAGGAVPISTIGYTVQWQDANGVWGAYSKSAIVTTTSGNQIVTITPPAPPAGATNFQIGRTGGGGPTSQDFRAIADSVGACTNFVHPAGTVVIDNKAFDCGALTAQGVATSASVGANGLAGQALTLTSNGFKSVTTPDAMTVNRTVSLPDVSGYAPITSYLNSAYDNATRANGAIGSNWTLANNGINIASNNFVGTTGVNNVAYWSASPFSASQFSQVTITALNGGSDFPGVTVLVSGSGGSTHAYNCIETTTSIFLRKITGVVNTNLVTAGTTGAPGDVLRLEAAPNGLLTCYKNGISTLSVTDTSYTSGQPGLFLFGTVATSKNWSGGNLHPLGQMDIEQDWTKTQHLTQGIALGGGTETFNANPRFIPPVFLPGALTSTWTGASWTLDKPITVTRVQTAAKFPPSGCSTSAVIRLTDGVTPVNLTLTAATNDSGAISQNYAAGATLTVGVNTAAAGCTASPGDANVTIQYRMQ